MGRTGGRDASTPCQTLARKRCEMSRRYVYAFKPLAADNAKIIVKEICCERWSLLPTGPAVQTEETGRAEGDADHIRRPQASKMAVTLRHGSSAQDGRCGTWKSAGTHRSQTGAALPSSRLCSKPEHRSPWRTRAPHALPGVLSQALGDKEVDLGELGLWKQAGARGRTRESLHSTEAKGEGEEQDLLTSRPSMNLFWSSSQMQHCLLTVPMEEGLFPRFFIPVIQTSITSYLATAPCLTLGTATKDKYCCPSSSISMDAAFSTFARVAVTSQRRAKLGVAPLGCPGWGEGAA